MFLKEVESKPAKGLTKIALQRLREQGEAVPEILHLFRFKTRATDHLVRFTEEVMRGPSPLSPGMRELIGAFFSKRSQCSFCSDAHAAAAAELLEKDLVDEVLHDLENSRLDSKHKALFRYIGKLAENPARVTASDIKKLKNVGWSEEAIYDALTVASVFRFYNAWNHGSGVETMASQDYLHSGKVLNTLGYCMDFKVSRLVKLATQNFFGLFRIVFSSRRNAKKSTRPIVHAKPAMATAGLSGPEPVFAPIEKSYFKEEVLNVSVRDE
ncbi:MAG TPA: hypothetical protein VGE41_08875 [Verrucomicrobiae bacterium]